MPTDIAFGLKDCKVELSVQKVSAAQAGDARANDGKTRKRHLAA
jgi:hypothetical protein